MFQLHSLTYEELQARISSLDPEMEREIDDLKKRYQAKRQPILDAIAAKKKRQQNFWASLRPCPLHLFLRLLTERWYQVSQLKNSSHNHLMLLLKQRTSDSVIHLEAFSVLRCLLRGHLSSVAPLDDLCPSLFTVPVLKFLSSGGRWSSVSTFQIEWFCWFSGLDSTRQLVLLVSFSQEYWDPWT